ncbi:MAG TPA: CoA transferase, partial [Xanthobacteraceae bacterium]|nr:CoA transferase [Xanthobacteraceae bacterium]
MLLSDVLIIDATDRLGWLAGRVLADLGADVIKLEPPGSDRSRSEWRAFNVNKRILEVDIAADRVRLEELLRTADICLLTPQSSCAYLDPSALRRDYPRLAVVAIRPFGGVGPRSAWKASDIELMAAGGAMALAGEPDGLPVRVSEPQSYGWAGAQAAIGALVALFRREATGQGDLVDVSAQASVIAALSHAPAFVDLLGVEPTRAGAFMTGRSIKGARYRVFWPCRDGYINFIFYGGMAGRRTNEQLVAWMRECGADLGALAAIDWKSWDPTKADQAEVDAIEAPVAKFFARLTKREFLNEGHRREMLGYPVATVADIASDPQLEARDFFQAVVGSAERFCGCFAVIDGKRPPLRHHPDARFAAAHSICSPPHPSSGLPEFGHLKTDRNRVNPTSAGEGLGVGVEGRILRHNHDPPPQPPTTGEGADRVRRSPMTAVAQALAGLKVLEFGGYAAGPHIGKVLANFGARTIHMESRERPDGFRIQYPPFKDNRPGYNRSGCFAFFNDSKYSVTVDLKKPAGVALARRMAQWCDLIIENMRPGVIDRLGLGFAALSKLNPQLVMLSTCNMGQTGPRADQPGFGSQLSALAGMCELTGVPDGPPMLLYGPYIDYIASLL